MEVVESRPRRRDQGRGRVRRRRWLHQALREYEGRPHCPKAGSSSERNTSGAALQLEPSSWHRRSPLDQIQGAVVRWCQGRDVSISSLRFQVETRLEPLHGPSLPPPPLIHTFEDALIDHLFASSSLDCLEAAN
ncbi:hypothetical protein J008_02449 [Cryptococcus neoformans]|nr:hypothetical protein AYX13_06821 [Cryptococcus neoformans var. grubii]OXH35049.1 hypothetical protein J008_02449 [Cryptococcus neoformans var. grubii]